LSPDKPFFLYFAPGAAHSPHHAPKRIDKFPLPVRHGLRGDPRADLSRQKELGHCVPADTQRRPGNPIGTPDSARPQASVPAAGFTRTRVTHCPR